MKVICKYILLSLKSPMSMVVSIQDKQVETGMFTPFPGVTDIICH
jgi:hypothetical protein